MLVSVVFRVVGRVRFALCEGSFREISAYYGNNGARANYRHPHRVAVHIILW
jgi:hypothetical protein